MLRVLQSEDADDDEEEEEIIKLFKYYCSVHLFLITLKASTFFRSPTLLPVILRYSYRDSFTVLASL
jgi:hypothetical protein